MPHRPWPKQSFTFGLFFFAYYGYIGVFSPYASLFFSGRGMSATEIGILLSLMQVMRIFGPNLWGWVADLSQARVQVLRFTAAAALAAFCGMFFGHSFWYFFAVMASVNLFTGAQAPLSEALMLTEMRGDLTHYGKLRLWGSVGFIAAVTAAGELLDHFGIDHMPLIAAALLALVLFASLRLRDSDHVTTAHAATSMRELLKRREVVAFFVSAFLMIAAHASLYVFYSLYLAQLGYSKTVIGMMWSLGVLAEIGFFYYQAPFFRRFGAPALLTASIAIAVLRFLLIGLGASSVIALVLAQILHAATFGAHHSASVATMQHWFSGRLQARGQALYTSIGYGLGGSFGGLGLTLIWDRLGAPAVFCAAAALALLALLAARQSFRWQALATAIR
ncbi:PPP family 3-phenylpropionic acid transporter [Actimicrobium sp. GrIS 1.19]|uniref:MFS transporter n=1 Tax=Actimicrobium sp. GrIS 1.19 TaxID=3071708 RepID=UPI002DF88E6A|nr:PPP family 3-phenylpropionic acid transporter [Actimicrobium sp. GrIS 1.19]